MCFCKKLGLIESDTLGNVQKKMSNNIFPPCFGMLYNIQIIIRAIHHCNRVIQQYIFKVF